MCRLWAAEAYNPACLAQPPPQFMALLCPLLCPPLLGWVDHNLEKFTVYVSVSGTGIMHVLTYVCVQCMHVYPDQLVRAQPLKISVSTRTSAHDMVQELASLHLHLQPLWRIISSPWSRMKQVEQQLHSSTFFACPSPYLPLSFPSLPSFHSFLSFPHYQGVACDWQMGTNNNFFFVT